MADKATPFATRLGVFGIKREPGTAVVPTMPVQAQVKGPTLHLLLDGGMYITGRCPYFIHTQAEAVAIDNTIQTAYTAGAKEPSYSGTGSSYLPCVIAPDADGNGGFIMFGGLKLARFAVDPSAKLLSGDEPLAGQLEDTDEDDA